MSAETKIPDAIEETVTSPVVSEPQKDLMPQGDSNPYALVAMAVQQNFPVEKLEKLLDLQERWEKNEARKAYFVAMASFSSNLPEVFKDKHVQYKTKTGSVVDYDHATLGNISATIGEHLGKFGLKHAWKTKQRATKIAQNEFSIAVDQIKK